MIDTQGAATRWTTAIIFPTEEAKQAYDTDLTILWRSEIVEANANLKLASAVREAPLDFLLGKQPHHHLLTRIGDNALREAAQDTINALTDKTNGALTVDFLRGRILGLCRPEKQDELGKYLDAEFAARNIPDLYHRARRLRHNYLAHSNAAHLRDPGRFAHVRVTRQEIGELLEIAKDLVRVLSFEVGRSFEFLPQQQGFEMPDLILDVVRKHSAVLRLPEEAHQLVFRARWDQWTLDERAIFDRWRELTDRTTSKDGGFGGTN